MGRVEEIAIDALDGAGCGLRAAFRRRGDRFEHWIVAVRGDIETPLLFADDLPLQEIVDHRTLDGRRALLATGSGDGRYWSLSVDSLAESRFSALGFDVACRDSPGWEAPGVGYRVAELLVQAGDELVLGDGRRIAAACGVTSVSAATEPVPTCRIESSAGQLAFRSNRSPCLSTAKMTRWRYEFQFHGPH